MGKGKESESEAVTVELEVDSAKYLSEDRGTDTEEQAVARKK